VLRGYSLYLAFFVLDGTYVAPSYVQLSARPPRLSALKCSSKNLKLALPPPLLPRDCKVYNLGSLRS
jgi:hypothetical protein